MTFPRLRSRVQISSSAQELDLSITSRSSNFTFIRFQNKNFKRAIVIKNGEYIATKNKDKNTNQKSPIEIHSIKHIVDTNIDILNKVIKAHDSSLFTNLLILLAILLSNLLSL